MCPSASSVRILLVALLSAAAFVIIPQAQAGSAKPTTGTCPAGNAAVVNPTLNVVQGGTATATFKIAQYCSNIQVNLASYDAPSADFSLPQTLVDYSPKPLNGGTTYSYNNGATYTLTTNVSPCFFQVDFVLGPVIVDLGPTDLYGSRKLLYQNGGSACQDSSPPQCQLTATVNGPPKQIQITVADAQSGLKSVDYNVKNGSVSPDAGPFTTNPDGSVSGSADFSFGMMTPLVLTVTKTNQSLGSHISLTVNNVAGLKRTCDPVVPGARPLLSFSGLAKIFNAFTKLVKL